MKKRNLAQEYQDLVHKFGRISRVPGYSEITLKTITESLKNKVFLLDAILKYLEAYPGMKVTGLELTNHPVQSLRYKIKVEFRCLSCKKLSKTELYPVIPATYYRGIEDKGIYCQKCWKESYVPDPPEPEEDDYRKHTYLGPDV